MRIQVASYNIHRGFGRDGRYDPERILRVLEEVNADVVALQEVDFPGVDPNQMVTWLAAKLSMTAVGGPVRSSEAGKYGNALLTRFPIRKIKRWDLSIGDHEPRGALAVDMLCQGTMIHVVTTHLGLWPQERPLQATRLMELLTVNREELTILMGDLNEWQVWGRTLRLLRKVFGSPQSPATFPAIWPVLALDRIWVAPAQALHSVEAHRSKASLTASDHLPVKAEVWFQAVNNRRSATA